MTTTDFNDKNSADRFCCPETGLSILRNPEWNDICLSENYKISVNIIENNIVWLKPSGYATLSDIKRALDFTKKVRTEILPENRSYVQIDDWSNLKGSSFKARKFYIRDLKKRKRLKGLIYYSPSPAFRIAIQLGRRFKLFSFNIETTHDFIEAVSLAHKMVTNNKNKAYESPSEISSIPLNVNSKKDGRKRVITDPGWQYKTENFSLRFEIINDNILHGITTGRLREDQIGPSLSLQEEVTKASHLLPDGYYFILGLSQYGGIGQKARKLYADAILELYKKYPFKMLMFYGASKLLKAAINLARPFVPFKIRVTNDLDSTLALIEEQSNKDENHLSIALEGVSNKKSKRSDQLKPYVDELLKFLGKINWEVDGINPDRHRDPSHPFNPVFGAIELIKWELDDLYNERELAEKALSESEEKFRKIVESSPMGFHMYRLEENGRLVFVEANLAADAIYGVDNKQFYGKDIEEAFPALADTDIPNRYRQICTKGEQIKGEQIHYIDKQIQGIFEVHAFQTAPNYMAVMFSDITERKQAEEALRRSEEKYRNILETIEDGYFELDTNGDLIFFNTALCKITGYDRDELMGLNYRQYSSLETAEKMFQVFNQIYQTGKPKGIVNFDINLKVGHAITIDLSAAPIKNSDRKIIGFRGMIRDVTERKKAEEERRKLEKELQQAQKMEAIGTLAGGVAHDLNNILTGIVSYPELILMDLPQNSPMRDSIKTIQESGKKATAIVQDLLTLARRGVSTSEIVNLNDIISEYLISPEFEKLKTFHPLVDIETCLDFSLSNIAGSPVHLSKTVMNLISNAAEAMVEGGTLSLSTENGYIDQPISGYNDFNEGDYVVLTVSDTGVGIAAEEINRIFEPFFTKKVMGRSGTGLGMAVVWGTVKDHKGYIHVVSELEKGTTIKLYFPITRKERASDQKSIELAYYMGNGESILVVDDVREQREIASKILSQLGYSVRSASSGEVAVKFMRNETADLIVLDMIMSPGIDGLETYERIISIHPNQKAIILSGFSETNRVKKAQQLGAGTYVRKPYTIERIGMAIKAELEKEKKAA